MAIPELPVRRYPAARSACPADDFGPENIGRPVTRKAVRSLCHITTITDCLKTDTHCRQCVGKGFATPGHIRLRAASTPPGRRNPWSLPHPCLYWGSQPDGGPAGFWCAGYGCWVRAVDLDAELLPLVKQGRTR
jgi:hypothetical protein